MLQSHPRRRLFWCPGLTRSPAIPEENFPDALGSQDVLPSQKKISLMLWAHRTSFHPRRRLLWCSGLTGSPAIPEIDFSVILGSQEILKFKKRAYLISWEKKTSLMLWVHRKSCHPKRILWGPGIKESPATTEDLFDARGSQKVLPSHKKTPLMR